MSPRARRISLLCIAACVALASWTALSPPARNGDPPSEEPSRFGARLSVRPRATLTDREASRPSGGGAPERPVTPAPKTGRIEITVRKGDGSPAEGYLVEVFSPLGGEAVPPLVTDLQGQAVFVDLSRLKRYAVRIADSGSPGTHAVSEQRTVDLVESESARLDVSLPLSVAEGTVVDAESKQPVAGAAVTAVELKWSGGGDGSFLGIEIAEPGRIAAAATSDAAGTFRLEGTWRFVRVEAKTQDGRAGTGYPEDGGMRLVVPVKRAALVSVRGVAVDETGTPLGNALVTISTDYGPKSAQHSGTTDPSGRFAIAAVKSGYCDIEVTLDGAVTSGGSEIEADIPLRIVVPLRTGLSVTVLDDATGAPVSGAGLDVSSGGTGDGAIWMTGSRPSLTGSSGRARMAVGPGPVSFVHVKAAGYPDSFLHPPKFDSGPIVVQRESDLTSPLEPGVIRDVVLRLRKGAVLTGRVLFQGGRPAKNARVRASTTYVVGKVDATTGADGRFRLEGVVAERDYFFGGSLRVIATLDGYVPAGVVPKAASTADGTGSEDVGDLVLKRFGVVRGRVFDSDAKAVGGAEIAVEGLASQGSGRAGEDGSFVVGVGDPVETGETPALVVAADGFFARTVALDRTPPPGGVIDLNPIFLFSAALHRVRVIDADGRAVGGAHVIGLTSYSGRALDEGPATDAEGFVTVDRVDADSLYSVQTKEGAHFYWAPGRRRTGSDVVIRLEAVRTVDGRVVDETGRPVSSAQLDLRYGHNDDDSANLSAFASSDEKGVFTAFTIPAGGCQLQVKGGGLVTRIVDVPAGAPTPLGIVLEHFGEGHRRRLAELQEQIRALRGEIEQAGSPEWDERRIKLSEFEQEARRLRGE